MIDGFNIIITIESALSGGVLLQCVDGCLRDLASIHGSYRGVNETEAAITHIGCFLSDLNPKSVAWVLDRPVSNSGKLAGKIEEIAQENNWPWSVELVYNPDKRLIQSGCLLITTDSMILDRNVAWVNLNAALVEERIPCSWIVDLENHIINPQDN